MARVKPQKPDIQKQLNDLNAISNNCWLGVSVSRSERNPNRSPDGQPLGDGSGQPMDRFVFIGDCFTSMDGEIAPDGTGFTIIYNHHLTGQYLEDGAFHGPAWEKGRFITWSMMMMALQYYVALANSPLRTFYTSWPPKALYGDSADSTMKREAGFTRTEKHYDPIGQVQIDGLYGSSQLHLRTTRQFTEQERSMILYALRIPMAGLVEIRTVAMRRIIVTSTIGPSEREGMAITYAKIINQVLDGGWLWELAAEVPHVPKLGKLYTELTPKQKREIAKQYPEFKSDRLTRVKRARWWKAETDKNERLLIAHSIDRLLEENEKRRGK